ncbi:MAG: hypothetical protein VB674_06165 [Vicinamibacterales bacterium]
MSDLLMKQIKFVLAFGIAVAWVSSNTVSAQVLNSFVERAKAQGGPLASVQEEAVTDADATEEETEEAQDDNDDLARRIDLLAEELERLRSGEDGRELSDDDARARGLAPSAAAVYRSNRGLSIAGYGEFLYENYAKTKQNGSAGKGDTFDALRAIVYVGYRFSDKFVLNTEIEIEHAKEAYLEFAYVDYAATENFGVRGGLLLVPMGLVNEFHEPTVFMGTERPFTENKIIPSTWRENGAGIYGAWDKVSFRLYAVNGFNGAKFSSGGLRGGRQKGGKAKAENFAYTGRLDVTPTPGVFFGGSFYSGGSAQGSLGSGKNMGTRIVDFHGQAQVRGFDFRGLWANASIDDAVAFNVKNNLTGSKGLAEKMEGGYVMFGYNLLSQTSDIGGPVFTPYVKFERVDTQAKMPVGYSRSLSTLNNWRTIGFEFKPIPNVVVKVDYMKNTNDANSGLDQFNVALGYGF